MIKNRVMNFFRFIKNNRQLSYLVVFIVFLMIPNLFLAVAINPVAYRLLCLMLSFCIYILFLVSFRKPAKAMLFAIPLVIFDVYQMLLIYMFGPYISGVDMILNIFSSDNDEAGELLLSFVLPILIGLLPVLLLAFLVVRSFRMKEVLSLKMRKTIFFIFAPLMLFVVLCLGCFPNGVAGSLKNDVYPVNAFYNVYLAGKRYYNIKTFEERSRNFRFDAQSTRDKDDKELYILLIGETSRAMNWQIYGYERNTTPRLDGMGDDLLVFGDVLTQSNTTHKSVPIILSSVDASNFSMMDSTKSIISAFKEAGFNTVSITNQPPNGSYTDFFLHEADSYISLREMYGAGKKDMDMIPILDSVIRADNKKQFVVIHSYGSHFNYFDRYDAPMRVFTDKKATKVDLSDKDLLVDTYDNAILYTDLLISEIIERVRNSSAKSSFMYLADHGEDLFDDERCRFLHATPDISTYQICIPFLIYANGEYRKSYSDIYDSLKYNTDKPFQSDVVFHTMLSISGIHTKYLNTKKSLVSHLPYNDKDERLYVDDRNNCRQIWSMTRNYKLDSVAYKNYIHKLKSKK